MIDLPIAKAPFQFNSSTDQKKKPHSSSRPVDFAHLPPPLLHSCLLSHVRRQHGGGPPPPPPPPPPSSFSSSSSRPLFCAPRPNRRPLRRATNPPLPPRPSATFNPFLVFIVVFLFFLSAYSAFIRRCSPAPEGSISVPLVRCLTAPRGLDPALVETFSTVIYSAVKGHKTGGASLESAVCLNDFEDEDMLRLIPRCDHAFHPDCIGAWLDSHTSCPVCRAELATQPAGNLESQQAESGTEPLRVQVTVEEVAPPDAGAPKRSQRGGEREGIQPPNLWDQNKSGSFNIRNCALGSSRMRRFPRSHSTGHSLIRPGEDNERFTLRLLAEVRKQLMDRPRPDRPQEGSSRRGYWRGGEGSSRGRYFGRPDRLDRAAKSERWAFNRMPSFFARVSSALSPGVAADGDGGSSRGLVQQARPAI